MVNPTNNLSDLIQTVINPDLPDDVLSSKQFNTLVELLSEGEIEGSATASKAGITDTTSAAYQNAFLKDIFLNNTQILQQSASNTNPSQSDFNFKKVAFDFRSGTANQTRIKGVKQVERETVIGTEVTQSNPVEHTVSDNTVETVRVTLRFNTLQKIEDNGNISGVEVVLFIKTIDNNGTQTVHIDDTVKGRSTNPYNRDYEFDIPDGAAFPVVVQVNRSSTDSTNERVFDKFTFQNVTEMKNAPQTYPNSAHIALRFGSENFPAVPRRFFRIRGVKILIPHNATVDATNGRITYSGTFNGTLGATRKWTSDPAWILYDLLTNDRYGCSISGTKLNKYTFYEVSQYCNELVSDGESGLEPRFSLNINITTAKEAFTVINELCSVMRVMPYYSAGGVELAQDSDADAKYIFNLSNVTEQGFIYLGSSQKTRHTVFNVSYFDMLTREIDYETVTADQTTLDKYGIYVKNVSAVGTTSRGQAQRLGKWFLYNEQNAGETVNFETEMAAGNILRVGDIVGIQDPMKSGVRRGGRIKLGTTPTTTQIQIDDSTNTDIPPLTATPTLSVILPDGSLSTKAITGINGTVLTVASPFLNASGQATAPNVNSVWVIETPTLKTNLFRIVSLAENDNGTFAITALKHDPNKYAFIEDGELLPERSISTLTEVKTPPENMTFNETLVFVDNKVVSKIVVSWKPVTGAVNYTLQFRFNNGNYTSVTTPANDFTIENADAGVYNFRVFSINAIGQPSPNPLEREFTAVGKTANPLPVQNLQIEPYLQDQVRLKWDATTELDVLHTGKVFIRHTSATSGGTFSNALDLIPSISAQNTEVIVSALLGTYILRYQDDGGRFSQTDASVVVTMPDAFNKLTILQQRESPNFTGTKTNTTVSSSKLKLTNTASSKTGSYEFANIVDLGQIFNLNLLRVITSLGVYSFDLVDSRTELVDSWESWDGTSAPNVNASISVATSVDNSTYTSFQTFSKGTFVGRYFKFKSNLITTDVAQNIELSVLGFDASLDMRTESSAENTAATNGVITSGTSGSGKDIVFTKNFFTGTSAIGGSTTKYLPNITVSGLNMASGDYHLISSVSGSGFNVIFKNSSNNVVSRNFTFTATGFGKTV